MKKLKLELETLAVDSYVTQDTETAGGTVAAHSDPIFTVVITITIATGTATVTYTIEKTREQ